MRRCLVWTSPGKLRDLRLGNCLGENNVLKWLLLRSQKKARTNFETVRTDEQSPSDIRMDKSAFTCAKSSSIMMADNVLGVCVTVFEMSVNIYICSLVKGNHPGLCQLYFQLSHRQSTTKSVHCRSHHQTTPNETHDHKTTTSLSTLSNPFPLLPSPTFLSLLHGTTSPLSSKTCSATILPPAKQIGTPVPGCALAPTIYKPSILGFPLTKSPTSSTSLPSTPAPKWPSKVGLGRRARVEGRKERTLKKECERPRMAPRSRLNFCFQVRGSLDCAAGEGDHGGPVLGVGGGVEARLGGRGGVFDVPVCLGGVGGSVVRGWCPRVAFAGRHVDEVTHRHEHHDAIGAFWRSARVDSAGDVDVETRFEDVMCAELGNCSGEAPVERYTTAGGRPVGEGFRIMRRRSGLGSDRSRALLSLLPRRR
ncbi:Phytoene [Hortaea werneckii]|nr:Phytoene [Hortaea werneckii]